MLTAGGVADHVVVQTNSLRWFAAGVRLVRQTQVTAQRIDALLAPREDRALIGGSGHRVHTGDAHRRVRIAQLGRRPAESLRELRSLRVLLASLHPYQSDRDHCAHDRGQGRPDHVDIAGGCRVLEGGTADDPRRQRRRPDPDDHCRGQLSDQRNPRAAPARGRDPCPRSSSQCLDGPDCPREQTTDDDGGYDCRHHADGQLSSNRQGWSPRHRRVAEGRAAGPPRCHPAGNDDHRNHRYRGVPDQSRSPQGRIRLDLRLFLLVVAVWTGDFLDGISNPSRHDHTVSLPPRRSRTKSARLRTGLPRWSSVKRHDHRRTGSIP